jgi:small multidrug resistance family-3 protein
MPEWKVAALYLLTAVAEIVGCYLPWLWLRKGASAWLLVPAAASLALFAWLLTLHPAAAGRVYAAYGGVYVAVALGWLWRSGGCGSWTVSAPPPGTWPGWLSRSRAWPSLRSHRAPSELLLI